MHIPLLEGRVGAEVLDPEASHHFGGGSVLGSDGRGRGEGDADVKALQCSDDAGDFPLLVAHPL